MSIDANTKEGWMITANVYAKESLRLTEESKKLKEELKRERKINDETREDLRILREQFKKQDQEYTYLGAAEYSQTK